MLGHGVLDEYGRETFAEGFYYSSFRSLSKKTKKRITILSCRGTLENGRKGFHLRWVQKDLDAWEKHNAENTIISHEPHEEDSLWVYGAYGKSVAADLQSQLEGWKKVMKNNN